MKHLKGKILVLAAAFGLMLTGCNGEQAPTVSKIDVEDPVTSYFVGDTFAAPRVFATYSNTQEKYVTFSDALTFTGYNMETASEQTVTVKYVENKVEVSTTYKITVNAITVDTLTATYSGGKVAFGGKIDKNKLKVEARYTDGHSEVVTDYKLKADTDESGLQTGTVSFGGKTATFNYVVEKQHLPAEYADLEALMEVIVPRIWGPEYEAEVDVTFNFMEVEDEGFVLTGSLFQATPATATSIFRQINQAVCFDLTCLADAEDDEGIIFSAYMTLDGKILINTFYEEDPDTAGVYQYTFFAEHASPEMTAFPREDVDMACYLSSYGLSSYTLPEFKATLYSFNILGQLTDGTLIFYINGSTMVDPTEKYVATLAGWGWHTYQGALFNQILGDDMFTYGALSPDGYLMAEVGYSAENDTFIVIFCANLWSINFGTATCPFGIAEGFTMGSAILPDVKADSYFISCDNVYDYDELDFYAFTSEDPTTQFELGLTMNGWRIQDPELMNMVASSFVFYGDPITGYAFSEDGQYVVEYSYLADNEAFVVGVFPTDHNGIFDMFPADYVAQIIAYYIDETSTAEIPEFDAELYAAWFDTYYGMGYLQGFNVDANVAELFEDALVKAGWTLKDYLGEEVWLSPDGTLVVSFMFYDLQQGVLETGFEIIFFEAPYFEWPADEVANIVTLFAGDTTTVVPAVTGGNLFSINYAYFNYYNEIDVIVYCDSASVRTNYLTTLDEAGYKYLTSSYYGPVYYAPNCDIQLTIESYSSYRGYFTIEITSCNLSLNWPAAQVKDLLPSNATETLPTFSNDLVSAYNVFNDSYGMGVTMYCDVNDEAAVLESYIICLDEALWLYDIERSDYYGYDIWTSPKGEISVLPYESNSGGVTVEIIVNIQAPLSEVIVEKLDEWGYDYKQSDLNTFLAAVEQYDYEYVTTIASGYHIIVIDVYGDVTAEANAFCESMGLIEGNGYWYDTDWREVDIDYSGGVTEIVIWEP